MEFSDDYIDKLLKQIHSGEINEANLPFGLYKQVCEHLLEGLNSNYVYEPTKQMSLELDKALQININFFSGAKTFNYVLANRDLLVNENNELRTWKDFKNDAKDLFDKYNKHWLEAEYDTVKGQAVELTKWEKFKSNANDLPLLEYVASIDDKTSPICNSKDGIVRPVNDPFWKSNSPLSHYRCRCTLVSHAYGDVEISHDISKVVPADGIFSQNPTFTGQIFDKSHPYFNIAGKYKAYAKSNFNLPIIENDK